MAAAPNLVAVTEARDKLKDLLETLEGNDVILLKHSRPVAALVSHTRYRELQELRNRIADLEDELSVLAAKLDPADRIPWEMIKADAGLM